MLYPPILSVLNPFLALACPSSRILEVFSGRKPLVKIWLNFHQVLFETDDAKLRPFFVLGPQHSLNVDFGTGPAF